MTDLHRLSLIQRSCCTETWTCPCRGSLNTTEVPLPLKAHDVGDAGCNRPQSPLPVDGSQLVKDGVQWHEWIPVTEPLKDSPGNGDGDGSPQPLLVQLSPHHRAETAQLLGDIGEEGDQVRKPQLVEVDRVVERV